MDSRAFCPAGSWAESSLGWLGTGRRSPAAGATSAPGLSWTPECTGSLSCCWRSGRRMRGGYGGWGLEISSKGLALPLGKAGVVWSSSWALRRPRCRRRRPFPRRGRGTAWAACGRMVLGSIAMAPLPLLGCSGRQQPSGIRGGVLQGGLRGCLPGCSWQEGPVWQLGCRPWSRGAGGPRHEMLPTPAARCTGLQV